MAIITKGSVVKGTPATFTLNKTDLATHATVAADAYFSDDANWDKVVLVYKSTVGGQPELVKFDATQATPTADFLVTANARDVFEIKRIVIYDKDGGRLNIPRADLTAAEFDIDFTAPILNDIVWTHSANMDDFGVDGGVSRSGGGAGWTNFSYSTSPITGDFVLTYKFKSTQTSGVRDMMLGYNKEVPTSGVYPKRTMYFTEQSLDMGLGTWTSGNAEAWTTNPSPMLIASANTECTFTITRSSGNVTYSLTNGIDTRTGTIESDYTGDIYPHVVIYDNQGTQLTYAKVS